MSDRITELLGPGPQRIPVPGGRPPTNEDRALAIQAIKERGPLEEMPDRWTAILTLDIQGCTGEEISERLRCSPSTICRARSDERYQEEKARRLSALDDEFVSMKPLAFAALRRGLTNAVDDNIALRASEQWLKTAGYGSHGTTPDQSQGLTAESVVAAMLRQSVSVTVNVHGDAAHVQLDNQAEDGERVASSADRADTEEPHR